jgi:hypothetical protein
MVNAMNTNADLSDLLRQGSIHDDFNLVSGDSVFLYLHFFFEIVILCVVHVSHFHASFHSLVAFVLKGMCIGVRRWDLREK